MENEDNKTTTLNITQETLSELKILRPDRDFNNIKVQYLVSPEYIKTKAEINYRNNNKEKEEIICKSFCNWKNELNYNNFNNTSDIEQNKGIWDYHSLDFKIQIEISYLRVESVQPLLKNIQINNVELVKKLYNNLLKNKNTISQPELELLNKSIRNNLGKKLTNFIGEKGYLILPITPFDMSILSLSSTFRKFTKEKVFIYLRLVILIELLEHGGWKHIKNIDIYICFYNGEKECTPSSHIVTEFNRKNSIFKKVLIPDNFNSKEFNNETNRIKEINNYGKLMNKFIKKNAFKKSTIMIKKT